MAKKPVDIKVLQKYINMCWSANTERRNAADFRF